MKRFIDAVGRLIERAFPVTMVALPALLVCAIAADIIFSWAPDAGQRSAVHLGFSLGKAGLILTAAALSYYAVRSLVVFFSKHGIRLSLLSFLVSFLRAVHPTFGETAIVLLAAHGYIMFFRAGGAGFNPYISSGISAYVIFAVTGTFGYLLYKNRTSKKIRTAHRFAVLFVVLSVCAHLIIVKFL